MEVFSFVGCIETTSFASQPHPALCALRPPFARPLLFRGFYSFFVKLKPLHLLRNRIPRGVLFAHPSRDCCYFVVSIPLEFLVIMESTYRLI